MSCCRIWRTPITVFYYRLRPSDYPTTGLPSKENWQRMTTELIQLTNQPKPAVVATAISDVPIAGSRTSATRVVDPRPTPQNTERAGRRTRWNLCGRLRPPFIPSLSPNFISVLGTCGSRHLEMLIGNREVMFVSNFRCVSDPLADAAQGRSPSGLRPSGNFRESSLPKDHFPVEEGVSGYVAVSAAMLWSSWSRCIESHRYPSCRS